MIHRAAAAMMMLTILRIGVETAPTERDPLAKLTHKSAVPDKSSALNLSRYLKQWLVSTKAAGLDGTTKTTTGTLPASTRAGRWRSSSEEAGPGRTAHMLKMISALEGLHRTLNSTLSSRITIMPRAHGRGSGRKNKMLPNAEGGVKPTTAPPADSTASRASADVNVPSLTGRNFRKSLPPQNKKTNKRVCFWKYCSQN
ncbi:urotensin II-related peptide [Paralichthys olivaceus]|uniref:urotensin II-related peptide n=1 Tax=Paralichthys olivaceus TaxID=8255 RepID=UPI0037501DA1